MIAIAALAFMLITGIAKANPVVNWFEAEKKKLLSTKKIVKRNFKEQFAKTKKSILNLFQE